MTKKSVFSFVAALTTAIFTASSALADDVSAAGFDRSQDVQKYGARGDGVTDDTAAIQRAIDAGGTVWFPAGTYLVGSIYLKSDGGLLLDDHAVLKAHPDPAKWTVRDVWR